MSSEHDPPLAGAAVKRAQIEAAQPAPGGLSQRAAFWQAWPLAMKIGAVMLLGYVLVAIFAPWIQTADPLEIDQAAAGLPPSWEHPFGTNNQGYDIFSRVVAATRLDLLLAISITAASLGAGTLFGALAGFGPRRLDELIMRTADALNGFPSLVLAIAIAYGMGAGAMAIVVAITVIFTPFYARMVRASVRATRSREYVLAARAIGGRPWRVAVRHLLPNAMGPVLVQASLTPGFVILETAALSFIGLGIQPPTPEWGEMLNAAIEDFFLGYWWTYVFPGLALSGAIIAFNLFGEGLERLGKNQ